MVFFDLRWNYSPLKEKAVQLPDGLFICFCRERSSLHTASHSGILKDLFGSLGTPLAAWSNSRLNLYAACIELHNAEIAARPVHAEPRVSGADKP
jgi:hypothetical protein